MFWMSMALLLQLSKNRRSTALYLLSAYKKSNPIFMLVLYYKAEIYATVPEGHQARPSLSPWDFPQNIANNIDLHSFEISPVFDTIVLCWSQKNVCVYFDTYQHFKSIRFLLTRSLYEATDSYTEVCLIIDNVV